MKKVTYQDLYEFNFLSDVCYSPNGKLALFAKHNACEKENGYKSYIWLLDVESGETRQLTFGGEEKGAKWLDDETILFVSTRNKGKGPKTDYFKLSLTGGEAEPFFSIPERVVSIEPMGDGKYLAAIIKHVEGKEQKADDEALDGRDLLVFDEIYFWFNGQGVRNKLRNTLVIFDSKTGKMKQVSKKYTQVAGAVVSPDKSKILFTGTTYEDMSIREGALFLYDVETGKTKTIVKQDKYAVGSLAFMGNDKAFFTINDMAFNGKNSYFCTLDVATGEWSKMEVWADAEAGGAVGTDCNMGGGANKKFYDGKLYMTKSVWGHSHLVVLKDNGELETVIDTNGSINAFDIANGKVLMTAMRDRDLVELYTYDLETKEEKRVTTFNKEYRDTHSVIDPEYFTFLDRDGVELDGWVLKPLGYKPGKKYPAILEMHGGPKGIFGDVFHHEMQILANMGYFVFWTNPRGSDGRGSEFANMTGNLGGIDFNDFMDFTDETLKRYPDIDEKRVGICGGSYGGFMCNWMIGHTDRYAAAASQRSISNYLTKSLTTDIGYNHNMAQLDTDPWHDFEKVWQHSPLKNGHLAKTPTLFIQSDEDYRCWMSDALQMFSALKLNGVDSKVVLFHGENHELSRSGKPKNRITRLTEICEWFEKYVKPVKK